MQKRFASTAYGDDSPKNPRGWRIPQSLAGSAVAGLAAFSPREHQQAGPDGLEEGNREKRADFT